MIRLLLGECVERMGKMSSESILAVVSDPPYGLEFQGAEWDRLDLRGSASRPNTSESSVSRSRRGMNHGIHAGKPALDLTPASQRAMQEWHIRWLEEVYRILIPGGHLKAFGGTRTFHRLAVAMEITGFEDLQLFAWTYGSGFPKSLDVGKAVAAHRLTGRSDSLQTGSGMRDRRGQHWSEFPQTGPNTKTNDKPVDPEWDGWGTALKPVWEPILVGYKP